MSLSLFHASNKVIYFLIDQFYPQITFERISFLYVVDECDNCLFFILAQQSLQTISTIMKKPNKKPIQEAPQPEQDQQYIQQEPQSDMSAQNQQQIDDQIVGHEEQNDLLPQQEENNQQNLQNYKDRQNNTGVCYLSRIPPYMKPNYIKKLLSSYLVERVYLLAESEWTRNNRIKRGGNKKICFREGWVEFADKRMAKLAALTLNGQKMVNKKGNFYSEDVWTLKYLPKFKWHHLTQRLAHEQRLKKERLKMELEQQKKIEQFYSDNLAKSKKINGIVSSKLKKGKAQDQSLRSFDQVKMVKQIQDNQ